MAAACKQQWRELSGAARTLTDEQLDDRVTAIQGAGPVGLSLLGNPAWNATAQAAGSDERIALSVPERVLSACC